MVGRDAWLRRHQRVGQRLVPTHLGRAPLGEFDAPFQSADRFEVLVEAHLIGGAGGSAQGLGVLEDRVHHRAVARPAGRGPEDAVEDGARLHLARQRPIRRRPRDAVARQRVREEPLALGRQLQRRQQRFLPDVTAGDLVRRHAAGADRLPVVVEPGEPGRRAPDVPVAERRPDVARDDQLVLERLERAHPLVQLHEPPVGSGLGRVPRAARDPVREVEVRQPPRARRAGRRLNAPAERGDRVHDVEQRQRHRGADSAQDRPPGDASCRHRISS